MSLSGYGPSAKAAVSERTDDLDFDLRLQEGLFSAVRVEVEQTWNEFLSSAQSTYPRRAPKGGPKGAPLRKKWFSMGVSIRLRMF